MFGESSTCVILCESGLDAEEIDIIGSFEKIPYSMCKMNMLQRILANYFENGKISIKYLYKYLGFSNN